MRFASKQKQMLLSVTDFSSQHFQEDIMRFIFSNEDRVWGGRGGRPKTETVEQFLGFLPSAQGDDPSGNPFKKFPGVIILNDQPEERMGTYVFDPSQLVGYCVGEFVSKETYEIVTAWVDPKYKGMNNAVEMYIDTMEKVHKLGAKFVAFDVVKGSPERIISSSQILSLLTKVGADRLVIAKRDDSYTREIEGKAQEKFEKLTLRLTALVTAIHIFSRVIVIRNSIRNRAPKLLEGPSISPRSQFPLHYSQHIHGENQTGTSSWWVTASFLVAVGGMVAIKFTK